MPAISKDIDAAVAALRQGELVAVPTETVYGLAADASNVTAVKKIYQTKGRPTGHPLIVHIASAECIQDWAQDVPEAAYTLAEQFWPGPLTLVLKKAPQVNNVVTGGQDTIGLRCPDHPLTQALLEKFKGGIAAPSANRFGHVSPTKPEHVQSEFKQEVALILDGGQCDIGIESTIVDLTSATPHILRQGAITAEMIQHICQQPVTDQAPKDAPQVSGSLASHYAPDTTARLVTPEKLLEHVRSESATKTIAVISRQTNQFRSDGTRWFQMPKDAKAYAHALYDTLRRADEAGVDLILVEAVPSAPEWVAVQDRLTKATN